MIEVAACLACVPVAVFLVWLVDRWRKHSTATCCGCEQIRLVDRRGRCRHCYEHDGGW